MKCKLVSKPGKLSEELRTILDSLDKECFISDPLYDKNGCYWWILYDNNKAVGFAGLKIIESEKTGFLCRAGILSKYRGKGYQKKLIKLREILAKKLGIKDIITYTYFKTLNSANSLISCGYKLYDPEKHWASLPRKETLYFKKTLS
jgi:N-acetylglutamate synthase-like GNAT family acetyltransferase